MKNQLLRFEQAINQLLLLHNEKPIPVDSGVASILQQVEMERNELRNKLDDLLFVDHPEDLLRRILRIYHIRLTALSNKVYEQFKGNKGVPLEIGANGATISPTNIRIVLYIDELIQYGILVSAEYHDPELNLPDYNTDIEGDALKGQYQALDSLLKKRQVHKSLLDIFQDYFGNFNSLNEHAFNYRQLDYAKKILQKIRLVLKEETSADCMDKIWEMVVNLNFNTERIRQFSATWIYLHAIHDKIEESRVEELQEVLTRLRAMDENRTWCYDKDNPSVKEHTESLLTEEIHSLEVHRHRILTELSNKEGNYFMIDLTVKQLILWAQISVLINRIPHHTPVHVFRILTIFVRTMNHGAISFKTARKKFGEFDAATVRGLHRYFTDVIKMLESKYGSLF